MTTQLTFEEARSLGQRKADACLEKAEQTSVGWGDRAYEALVSYINLKRGEPAWSGERAVEFVLRQPGVEKPHTTKAFGSLFTKAAKESRIARSSTVFARRHGHGTKTLGWVSL
jgi:hypothetical protein